MMKKLFGMLAFAMFALLPLMGAYTNAAPAPVGSAAGGGLGVQFEGANPGAPGAQGGLSSTGDSLIGIIQSIVNYILGMLAFICLLLLLYAGWLYLTGKTEEAMKWIKQVLIALLIIAASYFILSLVFYIISSFFGQ